MAHQTVGVTEPPLAIVHMVEQGEQVRTVSIITDDARASIAPNCDMVDGPGEFRTQRISHRARAKEGSCVIARPVPFFILEHVLLRFSKIVVLRN